VSVVSDGGQLKSFFDNLMRKQAREAGADRTMQFLDFFGQPSVGQDRITPQAFAMLNPEQQNQVLRRLREEGVDLGPYISAAGVEGTDVVDAANIAFNLPFDALSAVANLTNLERGREEGFRANIEGARAAFSESLNPDRFAAVEYAEEIGYPFPVALGTALDVAMPGPGELKPLLSLLAPRNITKFMRQYGNVEFVPARFLRNARGNTLRRTPEEMDVLREEIMANPAGIDDPIKVMFNPDDGTYHVGEGNHRVALAAEMGIPVPVVVLTSRRSGPGARPGLSPDEALANIRGFAEHHDYVPSNLAASEIGLPTVPLSEVADLMDSRAARGDFSMEEAEKFREFAASYQPEYMIPGTTQRMYTGTETVTRPPLPALESDPVLAGVLAEFKDYRIKRDLQGYIDENPLPPEDMAAATTEVNIGKLKR